MAWTPIVAGLVQRGFDTLGSAVSDPEPEVTPIDERDVVVKDTVYRENIEAVRELRNVISGTITPREIPIQRIVIPPKESSGSGSG